MFLLPPQGRKRLNDIGHVFLHVGAEDCGRADSVQHNARNFVPQKSWRGITNGQNRNHSFLGNKRQENVLKRQRNAKNPTDRCRLARDCLGKKNIEETQKKQ